MRDGLTMGRPGGSEHVDVLVVGAGISGIGAGYHLQTRCPGKTYAILEARERLGGTWDLFRYPGIRSDSDMHTLGFAFKPWIHRKSIADGPAILDYLNETTREFGIDRHIRFGHRVERASWSTEDFRWTLDVRVVKTRQLRRFTCAFLFACSGYYRYEQGYTPDFPGIDEFRGRVVHPQKWTDDIDYAGKRVVVIGSGATAMTLVPAMARDAGHVTMLQRSPTYVISAPEQDAMNAWLRERLPAKQAYAITRWKNIARVMLFYALSRRYPDWARNMLIGGVKQALGRDFDVATHFTPHYNPWDQRICLVPDGDLFDALKRGNASVVTDHIETFTERGIRLRSGRELDADLIVTATGLHVELFGGMSLDVDGQAVVPNKTMAYRAMMLGDVPNFAFAVGYTNASWTLKVDITCEYVCRLINHMDARGYTTCCPTLDPDIPDAPLLAFTSGYIQRALPRLPRGGKTHPWRVFENYLLDRLTLRHAPIEDGVMQFSGRAPSSRRRRRRWRSVLRRAG